MQKKKSNPPIVFGGLQPPKPPVRGGLCRPHQFTKNFVYKIDHISKLKFVVLSKVIINPLQDIAHLLGQKKMVIFLIKKIEHNSKINKRKNLKKKFHKF